MCGRFTLRTPMRDVAEAFDLPPWDCDGVGAVLRFNIAPSQPVLAVRVAESAVRQPAWLEWGLLPSWAEGAAAERRMINARGETVDAKRAFSEAFRRRRCLLPADGFFEWKRGARPRQPYYIHLADDRLFAFAGLWETWQRRGRRVESCAIVTTAANALLAPLHERMPVMLSPRDYELWLDPSVDDPARLKRLLRPYPAEAMTAYPVGSAVNSPRIDAPQCTARAAPGKAQGTLFE